MQIYKNPFEENIDHMQIIQRYNFAALLSVAEDALPFSQYCMKSFRKNTLTDKEIHFNYRLSRNRCVTENVFGIWFNQFRIFGSRAILASNKA